MPIPGYSGTVWKYRFPNSDAKKGSSGGYRVLAFYHAGSNTLYPFSIYTHGQYEVQPPKDRIEQWIKEILPVLRIQESPPEPR